MASIPSCFLTLNLKKMASSPSCLLSRCVSYPQVSSQRFSSQQFFTQHVLAQHFSTRHFSSHHFSSQHSSTLFTNTWNPPTQRSVSDWVWCKAILSFWAALGYTLLSAALLLTTHCSRLHIAFGCTMPQNATKRNITKRIYTYYAILVSVCACVCLAVAMAVSMALGDFIRDPPSYKMFMSPP